MRSLFLRFCASCASLRPSLPILFASFACFAGHLAAQPANVQADPTTGALFRPAAATFISGNSLLTTTAAAAAYQPIDADLTAIAALTTASYGRSLLTLADAAALRTSAALVIGTDVQAFDAELAAISGLSSNGLIARTSSSTAAARTLTGTAGQITVTNGDGVSGNPTLSLPTALTSINSITSAAASNLTLGTGTFGTALTFASATGAATFSAPVSVFGSTGTEVNFALNQSGVGQWSFRNIATSGDFRLSVGGNDWLSLVRTTGAATFTNTLSVSATTASTSTTTGALIVSGGAGFAGNIHAGGTGNFSGAITATGAGTIGGIFYGAGQTNNISIGTSGSNQPFIQAYNNAFNAGQTLGLNTSAGGAVSIGNSATITTVNGTTASTSTTTGSLVNAGGFGNAGAAYFGSTVSFTNQLIGNRASGGDIAELTGTSMTAGQTINLRFGSRLTSGNSGSWNFTYQGDNDNTNSMGFGYYGVANILTMTRAGATTFSGSARSTSATGGIGYATGAGGAVTQGTSRTTGVTLNNVCGAITLFTAAGSATWQSFTVTNSAVAATDTIIVNQRSGTDLYMVHVTAVGAGSFRISFATTGGTTSEAPVFNFSVIKAVSS
jgi:hypothetical protein